MNDIYYFVIGEETDPLLIIFRIVLFFIVFEGVMNIINLLISMSNGGKH